MINPPTGPLWDAVKAVGGQDHVWPMDNEETAADLAKAWQAVADQVGEGGFQASQAAAMVDKGWSDSAGKALTQKTTEFFNKVKEVALQVSQTGFLGDYYQQHLIAAKNAVIGEIGKYNQAYAEAGIPAPGAGAGAAGQQALLASVVAEICKAIVDEEADAIKNTLAKQATDARNAKNKSAMGLPGNVATPLSAAWSVQKSGLEKKAAELAEGAKANSAAAREAKFLADQADANSKLIKGVSRGLSGTLAGVGIAYDIANGKPVAQAVTAGVASWAAATAAGAAIGTLIPVPVVGTLAGAAGGFLVGAFTSGAVNSLFEHGPGNLGTAAEEGLNSIGDTVKGIGSVFS
jgi:hypothetical protein